METQSSMEVPTSALNTLWQRMRLRLEDERKRVAREIREYPTPIPRCDAQFNHLIELRNSIARGLQRLDEMSTMPDNIDAKARLQVLIDESSLSESVKSELRSIAAAQAENGSAY